MRGSGGSEVVLDCIALHCYMLDILNAYLCIRLQNIVNAIILPVPTCHGR